MLRTIGFYGQSNSTKSSQCYHTIKWYIEQYRRRVRYITADGGEGVKYIVDSGLEESGWVEVLDITGKSTEVMSTLMKIADGYWPRNGQFPKDSSTAFKPKDNIGMYVFEGGTSFAELIKREIASNGNQKRGFSVAFNYQEGDYSFAGVAMQHIGMIQEHIMRMITGVKKIPGLDFVVWTFHPCKAEEKMTRATMIGPQISGDSITPKIAKEFGSLIHLQREDVQVEGEDGAVVTENRAVAYFTNHEDPNSGLTCAAKVTIQPELIPRWNKRYPGGRAVLGYEQGIALALTDMYKLQTLGRAVGDRWLLGLKGSTLTEPQPQPQPEPEPEAKKGTEERTQENDGTGNDAIFMGFGSTDVKLETSTIGNIVDTVRVSVIDSDTVDPSNGSTVQTTDDMLRDLFNT